MLILDAATKLDEAIRIDYKNAFDFEQLSIAIQNAERIGVRIEKIDEAKNLLNNLMKNRYRYYFHNFSNDSNFYYYYHKR